MFGRSVRPSRAAGLTLQRQDGHSLRPRDWDDFYTFYMNTTGARKSEWCQFVSTTMNPAHHIVELHVLQQAFGIKAIVPKHWLLCTSYAKCCVTEGW